MKRRKCERRGMVWLTTPLGRTLVMATACHTWGCDVCAPSLLALFTARVEIGVSRLEPCVFIALTYQAVSRVRRDARSVGRDWQALWRRFRRRGLYRNLKWLKVPELTKKRVPHLHVLAGRCEGEIRCYGKIFDMARFKRRFDSCGCLSHVWSRDWFVVTGDSYLVHAVPVYSARGAGSYLGKYVRKGMQVRSDLESLGFKRRWSSSRGWPGGGRLRLAQTAGAGWARIDYLPGPLRFPSSFPDGSKEPRVGENVTLALMKRRGERREERKIRKVITVD